MALIYKEVSSHCFSLVAGHFSLKQGVTIHLFLLHSLALDYGLLEPDRNHFEVSQWMDTLANTGIQLTLKQCGALGCLPPM